MENAVLDQVVENAESYGEPIDVELEAGQISLHADLLLHGSLANRSSRRRCGLTLRYCSADVTAGLDWHLKGIVVAGRDARGHWANPPRPRSD
jgi:ectoine hydroxylase-related dioxygenase (phytanoyl-CoA dioxygenase family)